MFGRSPHRSTSDVRSRDRIASRYRPDLRNQVVATGHGAIAGVVDVVERREIPTPNLNQVVIQRERFEVGDGAVVQPIDPAVITIKRLLVAGAEVRSQEAARVLTVAGGEVELV